MPNEKCPECWGSGLGEGDSVWVLDGDVDDPDDGHWENSFDRCRYCSGTGKFIDYAANKLRGQF